MMDAILWSVGRHLGDMAFWAGLVFVLYVLVKLAFRRRK